MKANQTIIEPPVSFYSLNMETREGDKIGFAGFRGKKVLLVNTASDCGYTPQYAELEQLYKDNKDKLVIIGFPANDFGGQEQGTDEEIEQFCQANYAIDFPMARKSSVIKGKSQNSVFAWLTNKQENGWNNQPPVWNFSKYLVDEQGRLTHFFEPAISPLGDELMEALNE